MNPLKFNLKSSSVPVTLTDAEGKELVMDMREMNAYNRDLYLDQLATRLRLDAQGNPAGVKKFDGMQASLLSLCLFDADGKKVPEAEIQKWPASVVSQLFEAAQEMNLLTKAAGDASKNA